MKLAELIVETKLTEGTWSLPDSHAAVVKLMKVLDEPIKAADKKKMKVIYSVVGDDELFDDLDRAKNSKSDDVRPLIIKHLPRLLDTRTWTRKPDDETLFAISMLRKKHGL